MISISMISGLLLDGDFKVCTVLCQKCSNEFGVNTLDMLAVCDECGETVEFFSETHEDFVWHPSESY